MIIMERFWIFLILLFSLNGSLAFDGYLVLSITPQTAKHAEVLFNVEQRLGREVSVWNDKIQVGTPVNVHASPGQIERLEDYLQEHDLEGHIVIEDMGGLIKEQHTARSSLAATALEDFAFDKYHPLEEIEEWMSALVEDHKDIMELLTIGHSYEEHPIYAIRVSTSLGATEAKPVIWLDAGIHGREWIAPASLIYYMNEFVKTYQSNEVLSKSLETHDWYFMPVFNVDGYKYTWIEDENGTQPNRHWRKTRTPNEGQEEDCWGTDPNRNWEIMWGTTDGVSFDPCSFRYCGNSSFSERSVREVAYYLRDKINVEVYFAFHNSGQLFMLPYGYTTEEPKNYAQMMEVCERGQEKVTEVFGTNYTCGSISSFFGENSGSSADYTYAVLGINYTYGVELRDRGEYNFLLPDDQILPTAEESWPFVQEIVRDFLDISDDGHRDLPRLYLILSLALLTWFYSFY